MKNIPIVDLKKQYLGIKKEIDSAIKEVITDQFFILGRQLESFEKEFAGYLKTKYVVGVGSGTDALILALRALGIKKGDEVITQPNSFIATTLAITELGATPVFADVDPDTFQIDEKKIEKLITRKTKAILPVHLYGAPCQINEIVKIAKKNKLYIVEDACQSHGSTLNGKMTGTFGDLGVFSFYPGKNLGAYGDGGAVCTNNRVFFERLKKLRNYGQEKKYYHSAIGVNSRLDELQAAVLRVKLKHLNSWNKARNKIAKFYNQHLKKTKTQKIINNSFSNYHVFSILTKKRSQLVDFLKQKNIQTLIHYPVPIHLQKCYRFLNLKKGDFPEAEKICAQIISLPIFPELTAKDLSYIINSINTFNL